MSKMQKVPNVIRDTKISHYEMTTYAPLDLMKSKKITNRQYEWAVRDQCKGGTKEEQKKFYEVAYYKK